METIINIILLEGVNIESKNDITNCCGRKLDFEKKEVKNIAEHRVLHLTNMYKYLISLR